MYQLKHLTVHHAGCTCAEVSTEFPNKANFHMCIGLVSTALVRVHIIFYVYGDTMLLSIQ